MASIAPSKWSMSIHGDDRLGLKAKLYISRFYYLLSTPIIALYALILCGCISNTPKIPDIYWAELEDSSQKITTKTRFGYFGICISNDNGPFECSSSVLKSSSELASILSTNQELTSQALNLQQALSFFTPSIASVLLLVGLINIGILQLLVMARRRKVSWLLRKENSLDNHISHLLLASRSLLWGSNAVALAAAQAMHAATHMLQALVSSQEERSLMRGQTMEAMLWSAASISVLFNILMHFGTQHIHGSRPRTRKSTPLPFTQRDIKEPSDDLGCEPTRADNIRKITTATAQRLAMVGMHNNGSQQTLATTIVIDGKQQTELFTPSSINSPMTSEFQALNSPGLYPTPPLATLQRRPTNPKVGGSQNNKPSPLAQNLGMPGSPFQNGPRRSLTERRQEGQRLGAGESLGMKRIEIRQPPKDRDHHNERFEPLSPGLQSILKNNGRQGSVTGSSIYSRAAPSPREKKNMWV